MSLANNLARTLGKAARIIVDTAGKVAATSVEIVDDMLEGVADKTFDRIGDARHKEAMQDVEYARLQKLVDEDKASRGNDSVSFDLWMEQEERMNEILPPAKGLGFFRALHNRPLNTVIRNVKFGYQRLTRSWDDRATWSLDTYLCANLGAQLQHLAKTSHGHPAGEEFKTYEEWVNALNHHGAILASYGNHWDEDEYVEGEEVERRLKAAQDSLRWVADHLPSLWD